ncbi:ricin-type beta-trefoil lectin domain protein [Nonomuraea sp. NPDC049400]|uniref:ricin-type beta-trefoil lectin domain protein n=1 Tax=Nonomuraea sp. NPDC049400 TaxID=3364352 RepID=UPI0037A0BDDC
MAGAGAANGTAVQLWDCNGTAAQSRTWNSDGSVRALGKCMDVTGGSTANGTRLQIWDCSGGANQRWTRA